MNIRVTSEIIISVSSSIPCKTRLETSKFCWNGSNFPVKIVFASSKTVGASTTRGLRDSHPLIYWPREQQLDFGDLAEASSFWQALFYRLFLHFHKKCRTTKLGFIEFLNFFKNLFPGIDLGTRKTHANQKRFWNLCKTLPYFFQWMGAQICMKYLYLVTYYYTIYITQIFSESSVL